MTKNEVVITAAADAEATVGEERQRQHRMRGPPLPADEGRRGTTAATAKAPTTSSLVQPRSGPSMMANSRAARPINDSTAPRGSSGVASSSRDRGCRRPRPAPSRATTGTLTRNAEPHQNRSRRAPDTIGPMAPPAPAKPTQMAIARWRSSGGKIAVMQRQRRRHHERRAGALDGPPGDHHARPRWPGR